MHRLLPGLLIAVVATASAAQAPPPASSELAPQVVSLADLSAFRTTSANWRIAGNVSADRNRALALLATPGSGVLVNMPTTAARAPLVSTWEHGDIDLSFDVMVPKGASSGVYLMGRYEVSLADSWSPRVPTSADLGGIAGTPPRQNASRAPGLWQHVDIMFRAPTFDGGRKIANARFARVMVNGVAVHENVEVAGPTRGAAFTDERETGALVIRGDGGPIALRNIRYKSYAGEVKLSGLHYRVFQGAPMDSSYVATHAFVHPGDATFISANTVSVQDQFALAYDGTLTTPTTGRYRFTLDLGWIGNDSATRGARVGGGKLTIDGVPVLVHSGGDRRSYADRELPAGPHPFSVSFYKNRPSFNRRNVALWVEGPGVARQPLHDEGEAIAANAPVNPIVVDQEVEPVLIRSFLRHRNTKRVTAVSVADPRGVHYSYDMAQGALLYAWRGPFLETTQMWHERGEDQTAEPLGSVLTLPGTPTLVFLDDAKATWPDSIVDERALQRDGYRLNASRHPTFLYRVRNVVVEDAIRPGNDGLSLRRELHLLGTANGLYVQLAQGDHITRERDGSYVVGDRSFYVTLPGGGTPPGIRTVNGRDELLMPVRFDRGEARIVYTIVW
ncbi:MAG: family 16 glycoside hydrolase [Gemmatimonadaceae bacterium]